jgi:hypothetical protein
VISAQVYSNQFNVDPEKFASLMIGVMFVLKNCQLVMFVISGASLSIQFTVAVAVPVVVSPDNSKSKELLSVKL